MFIRGVVALAASGSLVFATPGAAWAEPEPAPEVGAPAVVSDPIPEGAVESAAPEGAVESTAPEGAVESAAPASTKSPDGWTMTISAKDETQDIVAPLTTAISSRAYVVGGVFNGSLTGPGDTPHGVFEVGYQIGCGIDMSTSNGVSLTGTAAINPSIGYFGFDFPGIMPDGLLPGIGGSLGGGITVGLKPGMVNTYPVTKKEYKSSDPWVSINNFHVKIDGCVGESFIRSYATLTKSTDSGDAILSWYGETKAV